MTAEDLKKEINKSLNAFASGNFTTNGLNFFQTLGYVTERQSPLHKPSFKEFEDTYIDGKKFDELKAKTKEWKYVDLLFQLSKEEVLKQNSLFDTKKVDNTVIETYLFFAIELNNVQYSRTELSLITREVNRLFPMPAMILFKYGNKLTLSMINRRLHKKDESKDVLEKVTLIKDINIADPHRAHLEILYDLSFEKLNEEFEFKNFVELHNGWSNTLNIKTLNNKFYKDIANWFFWACKHVEFPDDDEYYQNRETRNSENVIRLLTRIIFCWFMKEKGLIKGELFKENEINKLLIKDADKSGSTYYKAILQNLFFATLNIPVKSRKFITDKTYQGKNKNHFDHSVFRYKRFFKPNTAYLNFFKDIPFLNGGLFECQDYKLKNDNGIEETIRIDCFSDNEKNEMRLKLPDEIFFNKGSNENWLNDIFGTKNQDYVVKGIFKILNEYKFTIQENTELEEEIALDPDLLGIVFENLLASYNPETRETARKQTGSFYTPREIVSYMVDESLVAYFKNKIADADEEKIRELLSASEQETKLSNSEKANLINAIDKIKIIDPACGSGAFPMGILQKLVHLIHKLDKENILWKKSILARTPVEIRRETEQLLNTKSPDYIRKLGLIQNCIYGVDIQPIAVEISKLRFFLSLLVDFEKTDNAEDNWGIEPLPNLDFKIMQGNSLVEEFNGVSLKMKPDESSGLINFVDETLHDKIFDLHEKQGLFLRETDPTKKKNLKEKVNEELVDIFHYQLKIIKSTYFNELNKIENNRNRIVNKVEAEKYYEKEKNKADKKYGFNYLKFEKDLKQLISGKKPRNFFPYSLFFAEVFENNGFDIVIGNPPYISNKEIPKADKLFYENNFKVAVSQYDLFTLFIEKSISILNKIGSHSFIIPDSFLGRSSFKNCRLYLLKHLKCNSILHFNKVFEEAVVSSMVYVASRTDGKDLTPIKYLKAASLNNWLSGISSVVTFDQSAVNENIDAKILHLNPKELKLLKSIFDSHNNLDSISVLWRGEEIGKTSSLIDESSGKNKIRILSGGNINKYIVVGKEKYILKSDVQKSLNDYSKEKVCVRQLGDTINAAYDFNGSVTVQSVYNILPSMESPALITAILNSKVIDFIYQSVFREKMEFPRILLENLKLMPIPKGHENEKSKINSVVSYLIVCKETNSTSSNFFERLINAMLYELYLPESIKNSKCEVMKHLTDLPNLKSDWSEYKKLQTIEKVYAELSNSKHPVNKAIDNMDGVEEIRIIEGKQ
ncbi:MAG: TaqI-like C-terminal specificity domain-containing protein [Bacteroidota bacterium]